MNIRMSSFPAIRMATFPDYEAIQIIKVTHPPPLPIPASLLSCITRTDTSDEFQSHQIFKAVEEEEEEVEEVEVGVGGEGRYASCLLRPRCN